MTVTETTSPVASTCSETLVTLKVHNGDFYGVSEDPFGNTLRSTGSYADDNPFRFSTKYYDQETGLEYYGYRFYNPELGRWLNRDPIGEFGEPEDAGETEGIEFVAIGNLYAFGPNNPINGFDRDGEIWTKVFREVLKKVLKAKPKPKPKPKPKSKPKKNKEQCKIKRCKPCIPPVGSIAYRVDLPPSPSHNGIPTPHSHQFRMNQSPPSVGCKCFWVSTLKNPIPGVHGPPIRPASGGGVAP